MTVFLCIVLLGPLLLLIASSLLFREGRQKKKPRQVVQVEDGPYRSSTFVEPELAKVIRLPVRQQEKLYLRSSVRCQVYPNGWCSCYHCKDFRYQNRLPKGVHLHISPDRTYAEVANECKYARGYSSWLRNCVGLA